MNKQKILLKINICYLMMYLIFNQLHTYRKHIYSLINIHTDKYGRILNIVTMLVILL